MDDALGSVSVAAENQMRLRALEEAANALEFRLEWLDDYGDREYGQERAAEIAAHTDAALKTLRKLDGEGLFVGPSEIVARYDISGFDARELDALIGELHAQAEPSDGHPAARVVGIVAPELPREGRTVLVHINVTLPPDAPATAEDVAREIEAALEIAAEDPSGNAPALQSADAVDVPLYEEI